MPFGCWGSHVHCMCPCAAPTFQCGPMECDLRVFVQHRVAAPSAWFETKGTIVCVFLVPGPHISSRRVPPTQSILHHLSAVEVACLAFAAAVGHGMPVCGC